MSDLVDPAIIEAVVGTKRSKTLHYGIAMSDTGLFYILHSELCLSLHDDLRDCPFSIALDKGPGLVEEDVTLILYTNDNGVLFGVRSEL